nr:uncharacterized protein LOC109159815 [Ipomoea batatas]
MSSQLGNNLSYIWRSIIAGKPLLSEGVVRRVGDEADTKIWGLPWLANSTNSALYTPIIKELRDAPIKDTWRWKGNIRGMYSVRHGYKLLTASSLHLDPQLHFIEWKNLLSLPVPPKVKNFLWRCMHHVLPVREILKKRNVWAGGGCPFYPEELETMEHIFCDCAVVNQSIWACWNDLVWKDIAPFPSTVRRQVEVVSSLWSDTYSKTSTSTVIDTNSGSWILPPINKLKCNVDAAIFDDWAGFGAVVRNHEGGEEDMMTQGKGGGEGGMAALGSGGEGGIMAHGKGVKETLWLKAMGR